MKRVAILSIVLVLFSFYVAIGQAYPAGKVQESLKMKSAILGRDVKYTIYLPSDYETSQRRYPVLYLLHGYTDDETGWIQFGEANHLADKAIGSGEAPSMIIVMPDAGVTWYVNDYKGKNRYEDMFVKELIPYIDATYRTRTKKEFRAISGLSMGGHGALVLAMHNPDLFASCAAFSAGIFSDEEIVDMPEQRYNTVLNEIFSGHVTGEARLTESWKKNSPLILAKTLPEETLKKVRWYFDCGDDDFLYKGNSLMHIALRDRNIPHEFRMREGAHEWSYWRTGLPAVLKFVGEDFNR